MKTLRQCNKPLLLGMLLASTALANAQVTLLHSLYDTTYDYTRVYRLGWSVAAEGNLIAVGAPCDDTPRTIIFDATTGSLKHMLISPSPLLSRGFGRSVAISGSRIVVGAFLGNSGAIDSGNVFVYDLAKSVPTTPVMTLTNPSPEVADYFGFTVAISGNRIAVGAIADDTGAEGAGSVYVYDLASPVGAPPVYTLTNPSPATSEQFGNGLAIHDTLLVIGGYNDENAYVYDLAGATPTVPMFPLRNPGRGLYADQFGSAMAISGTRAVIGSWGDDTTMSDAGVAYIYDLAGANPAVPSITLTNPSPAPRSYFGYSVSISGTRVVVGTLLAQRAYVYELTSATPTIPVATLVSPSPAAEEFGFAVAVAGTTVVVGTPSDSTRLFRSGAAYLFGPNPTLSISRPTPAFARIAWTPTTSSGFVLQYRDGFGPGTWLNAPSGPTNPITVPAMNVSRYYRLYRP